MFLQKLWWLIFEERQKKGRQKQVIVRFGAWQCDEGKGRRKWRAAVEALSSKKRKQLLNKTSIVIYSVLKVE